MHDDADAVGAASGGLPARARRRRVPPPHPLDGDDITAIDEWVGDRDAHSEDRQLLLDAIMSAEDRLLVVYAGMDPQVRQAAAARGTGRPSCSTPSTRPPGPRTERRVRQAITVTHPLQPFDERELPARPADPGRPGLQLRPRGLARRPGGPGRAARGPRRPIARTRLLVRCCRRSAPTGPRRWRACSRFFAHPVRALLRDRAQLSTWRPDDEPDEQIPVDLNGLDRWKIGDRLLRQHLQGLPLDILSRGGMAPRLAAPEAGSDSTLWTSHRARGRAVRPGRGPTWSATRNATRWSADLGSERLTGGVARVFGDDLVRVELLPAVGTTAAAVLDRAAGPGRQPARTTVAGRHHRGRLACSALGPVPGGWAAPRWPTWSTCSAPGWASRCPSPARTSAEYARSAPRPAGRADLPTWSKTWARTATSSTNSSSARRRPSPTC